MKKSLTTVPNCAAECHDLEMKLVGKIEVSDLEGGMMTLVTAKGERYQLSGELAGLVAGAQVELTGEVKRDLMGFGMGGAPFVVKSHAAAMPKAKKKK